MSSKPKPKLKSPPTRPTQKQQELTHQKSSQKPNKNAKSKLKSSGVEGEKGGGNNNYNHIPSPWIEGNPTCNQNASFVEYLRWMRPKDGNASDPSRFKEATKIQLMQLAQTKAEYGSRLDILTKRTKLIAGEKNCFIVECPWRIRVGGHRGPEDMLLPAFDATGMPYIPSSTLRGVARTQAIREKMQSEKITWEEAEQLITPYFGALGGEKTNTSMGKVTFLDAYPLSSKKGGSDKGGLEMDVVTNIWQWDGDTTQYKANPNPFFSLKDTKFLIGLRLSSNCSDDEILSKVRKWLVSGLEQGIGSQINSGYGELKKLENGKNTDCEFFRLSFGIKGQLIHCQKIFRNIEQPYYSKQNKKTKKITLQANFKSQAEPEVRPIAFKSMLRYWFRAFSLGVLPPSQVIKWEGQLFGAIEPNPTLGWVKVNIENGKVERKESKSCEKNPGKQQGILTLSYSPSTPKEQKLKVSELFTTLTWLAFRLGGVGLGARRPYYERNSNPWYRGSCWFGDDEFWLVPSKPQDFAEKMQTKIQDFYQAIEEITGLTLDRNSNSIVSPSSNQWAEAVDRHCQIIVVPQEIPDKKKKPLALEVLHQQFHSLNNMTKEKNLCGGAKNDYIYVDGEKITRKAVPSPIWVANYRRYQVVTVFGANQSPRSDFLKLLEKNASESCQVFPF